jgi:mannose-6-phosphate isomerase-like protein (cupin superfamily)
MSNRDDTSIDGYDIRLFLLSLLIYFGSRPVNAADAILSIDDIDWGAAGGGGGFPVGVRTQLVATDKSTQGITYYAWFPEGSNFDMHWHSFDEYAVVLQGNVFLNLAGKELSLEAGAYVEILGKINHAWNVPAGKDGSSNNVILLVRRAGPADFHFVE